MSIQKRSQRRTFLRPYRLLRSEWRFDRSLRSEWRPRLTRAVGWGRGWPAHLHGYSIPHELTLAQGQSLLEFQGRGWHTLDRATQAFSHGLLRGPRQHLVSPRSAPPLWPSYHATSLHRTASCRTSSGATRSSTSTILAYARHVYTTWGNFGAS